MYEIKSKHIVIPENINCYLEKNYLCFVGPLGKITHNLPTILNIYVKESKIFIEAKNSILNGREYLKVKSLLSTTFVLFNNYINGVLNFFEKTLVLKGIGYKIEFDSVNNSLIMNIGYSKPVFFKVPDGILIDIVSNTEFKVKGISKHKVGQVAADIRANKLPDSYKGNGIRYKDDVLLLKVPKKTK